MRWSPDYGTTLALDITERFVQRTGRALSEAGLTHHSRRHWEHRSGHTVWYGASVVAVRATAWHNGGSVVDAAGYGIKFSEADRDSHFDTDWNEVVLELDGMEPAVIPLSNSFWRSCSELRSAAIGRWLLDQHAAPWRSGEPPGIVVHHLADNRFTARLLKRRDLRARS